MVAPKLKLEDAGLVSAGLKAEPKLNPPGLCACWVVEEAPKLKPVDLAGVEFEVEAPNENPVDFCSVLLLVAPKENPLDAGLVLDDEAPKVKVILFGRSNSKIGQFFFLELCFLSKSG